jgi:hypothetical protein
MASPPGISGSADGTKTFFKLLFLFAAGVVAVVVTVSAAFASAVGDTTGEFWQIAGTAGILAASSAVIGGLLGFLFGIPHALQRAPAEGQDGLGFESNTNLEQISDWITKILVGISLVQIGNAAPTLGRLAASLSPMLGDDPASPGFGLALCLFAVVAGFLLVYMWTRVEFWSVLEHARHALSEGLKKKVKEEVAQALPQVVEESKAADAEALSLLELQLSGQEPTPDELRKAFAQASKPTLVQVYQKAEDQRANTWRGPEPMYREQHDRTIGVFEALIDNDRAKKFHRHFASLGFALKDQAARIHDDETEGRPERDDLYSKAIANLTKAIDIRGHTDQGLFPLYEWCRAACRIQDIPEGQAVPDTRRGEIEADLRAAAKRLPDRFFITPTDDDASTKRIVEWLEHNSLSHEALRG